MEAARSIVIKLLVAVVLCRSAAKAQCDIPAGYACAQDMISTASDLVNYTKEIASFQQILTNPSSMAQLDFKPLCSFISNFTMQMTCINNSLSACQNANITTLRYQAAVRGYTPYLTTFAAFDTMCNPTATCDPLALIPIYLNLTSAIKDNPFQLSGGTFKIHEILGALTTMCSNSGKASGLIDAALRLTSTCAIPVLSASIQQYASVATAVSQQNLKACKDLEGNVSRCHVSTFQTCIDKQDSNSLDWIAKTAPLMKDNGKTVDLASADKEAWCSNAKKSSTATALVDSKPCFDNLKTCGAFPFSVNDVSAQRDIIKENRESWIQKYCQVGSKAVPISTTQALVCTLFMLGQLITWLQ